MSTQLKKYKYRRDVIVSVNECRHYNVGSINNKNLKLIKIIQFKLLFCNFIFINKIRNNFFDKIKS